MDFLITIGIFVLIFYYGPRTLRFFFDLIDNNYTQYPVYPRRTIAHFKKLAHESFEESQKIMKKLVKQVTEDEKKGNIKKNSDYCQEVKDLKKEQSLKLYESDNWNNEANLYIETNLAVINGKTIEEAKEEETKKKEKITNWDQLANKEFSEWLQKSHE